MAENIIWTPQPRQIAFMQRPEYECLYGGAAGGGKSDALIAEALRQVHIPHYKAIIFRKTYKQLTELIDKSLNYYSRAFPNARYNKSEHCWYFPSGAKIYFGNMQSSDYKTNYQGKAYDFVGFDELTHFTYDEYSYMFSRNRANGPGTRVYIRATTNPGGIGHGWVKERFITAAPPMTPIKYDVTITKPDGEKITIPRKRIFVPATVYDNQELLKNNVEYIASLAMLPEAQRKALLEGDWDSFEGQVFTEWRNDPEHYDDRRWTHVINPFRIPSSWTIYRGFDWGYSKPFSVGWYAVDHDGKIYRIREYYGCNGNPNQGVKIQPVEIAAKIRQIEQEDPNLKGRKIITGIADPAIFEEQKGESIASMMERSPNFVYWEKGDHSRIPGKMQYHYRLAFDEDGDTMFQVFNTCKHYIRTIPNLIYDEKDVEDIDTDGEDHIYDESRYVFMEHPIAPRKNVRKTMVKNDPLDLYDKKGNYKFINGI